MWTIPKAPVGIAKVAQKYNVPAVCLSGGLGRDYQAVYACGIDAIASITPRPLALEACMENGTTLIEDAAERLARLIAVRMKWAVSQPGALS